jgi:hypothetical protein
VKYVQYLINFDQLDRPLARPATVAPRLLPGACRLNCSLRPRPLCCLRPHFLLMAFLWFAHCQPTVHDPGGVSVASPSYPNFYRKRTHRNSLSLWPIDNLKTLILIIGVVIIVITNSPRKSPPAHVNHRPPKTPPPSSPLSPHLRLTPTATLPLHRDKKKREGLYKLNRCAGVARLHPH